MTKRIIAIAVAMLVAFAYAAAPAMAYTPLQSPVTITASGTLAGTTIAFSAGLVTQSTGTSLSTISFSSPNGISDSGAAIKIKGGTNEVNARVIIYTENNLNTVAPNKAATVNPDTGIDGGGLVGQTDAGYSVALFWGTQTGGSLAPVSNNAPNTNVDYVFGNPAVSVEGGTGNCNFIVDKRHTMSFTPKSVLATSLDCKELYKFDGTLVENIDNDGLYPQSWDIDLYDSPTVHNDITKVSPSLYGSIATVMFGISTGADTDAGYYVGNVPELKTKDNTGDSIMARLSKTDATPGGEMYIYIGGDFAGKPAQTYSTAKLTVALVQG